MLSIKLVTDSQIKLEMFFEIKGFYVKGKTWQDYTFFFKYSVLPLKKVQVSVKA